VAKVMVSLPDELLHAIDVEAARRGTTRSGLLRALAEETLESRARDRAARMRAIDASAPAGRHGGDVAEVVKSSRPSA
jgi:metal-responsive CopG/Arc/MetJ family transcriptional regulator